VWTLVGGSVTLSGVTGASAAGSQVVDNRVNSVRQTKPVLDVRDVPGIDCTYTNDSSVALNAITNNVTPGINGAQLLFPPNCHIKLTSTWTLKNQSAFRIAGNSTGGNNCVAGANCPTVSWCGSQGGTMIDIQSGDGFTLTNFQIDGAGGGSGCTNAAGVLLNIDKAASGSTTTPTDVLIDRMTLTSNIAAIGPNANSVLVRFSNTSSVNVDSNKITNSSLNCSPGVSGYVGVQFGASANVKGNRVEKNGFNGCTYSILLLGGSNYYIANNFFSATSSIANPSDLQLGLTTEGIGGAIIYTSNRSEPNTSTSAYIRAGSVNAAPLLTVSGNEFSGTSRAGAQSIDLSAATQVNLNLIGNQWDNIATEVAVSGSTVSGSNRLVSIGNKFADCSTAITANSWQHFVELGDNCPNGNILVPNQMLSGGSSLSDRNTYPILFGANQLAVNGTNHNSPAVSWAGDYWTGSASAQDIWRWFNAVGTGATPTSTLTLEHTGSSGVLGLDFSAATTVKGAVSPGVYEAGVLNVSEKIYTNTQALTAGAATHTLANSFTYTSSATFGCSCTDQTAAAACRAVPASATTVTLAGTGTDTLWLSCSGH
jgi:hypothetical protein